MRIFRNVLILIALLSLLSGCFVYSINPFYTEDKVSEYLPVVGTWECVDGCDGERPMQMEFGKNWQFNKDSIVVTDEEGRRDVLTAAYFKVGETVYLDTTPKPSEFDVGSLMELHIVYTHVLSKVEIDEEKGTMMLTTLDGDWFYNTRNELPCQSQGEVQVCLTAPEQWIAFLEEHHDSKDIYGASIVLKRTKTVPSPE